LRMYLAASSAARRRLLPTISTVYGRRFSVAFALD
jgi:hypothetical protein